MSLEQAAVLARSHGLLPKCIMQATDIMRKQVNTATSPSPQCQGLRLHIPSRVPGCQSLPQPLPHPTHTSPKCPELRQGPGLTSPSSRAPEWRFWPKTCESRTRCPRAPRGE